VEFTLTGEEYAVVMAAAGRAGLARRAYAAQAAMAAAANGRAASDQESLGQILIELMRAAGLVRRIASNLNQAVAKLNATGQRSGDLLPYAQESIRRATRLEAAGEDLRKRFVCTIRAPGPSRPRGPAAAPESAGPSAGPG